LASFQEYLEKTYAPMHVRLVLLEQSGEEPLRDVASPREAEIAFRVIYQTTRDLKRRGYRLHSLIAGGRKSIIIYSVLSAQLLFDARDKLWHIFSRDEYERDRFDREMGLRPHVPDDLVQLVEVPVLYVSRVAPLVRELILHSDDPTQAVRVFEEQEEAETLAYLQRFYDECDEVDRQILLLRYQGYPNSAVGERVYLSESAVSNHLKVVAERYFRDTRRGRSRYAKLPPNPQGAILHELRHILSRIAGESLM
jgi:hypothetical protein